MTAPKGFPIRHPDAESSDSKHSTDYDAARGGWYPPKNPSKPEPATKRPK